MNNMIFIITAFQVAVLLVGALLTLLIPRIHFWPPPSKQSWQFYVSNTAFFGAFLGLIFLIIINFNSGTFYTNKPLFYVGIALFILGCHISLWGANYFGSKQASGLKGTLKTDGLYQYVRNPQYVGDILLLSGLGCAYPDLLFLVLIALAISFFILAPFLEEPWLKRQYGKPYTDYLRQVPRFIPRFNKVKSSEH